MTWPASTHKGWPASAHKKKSAGNFAVKKHIVKQHKKRSAGKHTLSSTGTMYVAIPPVRKGT